METATQQTETVSEVQSAEQQLSGCWAAAAIEPKYPCTTGEVVKLLRSGGGYDCNPELLDTWARSKTVPDVAVNARGFSWSAENILTAGCLLNSSRRWLLSSQHVAKMSGLEMAELQARQVGQTVFEGIEEVDYRTLVGIISNERTEPETRAALCRALQSKLEMAGLI